MSKLNLVIADTDRYYVEGLAGYLSCRQPHRFQATCFTEESYLTDYLYEPDTVVDILLVSPEMYHLSLPTEGLNTVIMLSPGRHIEEYENCEVINKYQTGDKLVGNILRIYSEKNPGETHISSASKDTKVIGVFSPNGGAGKTSIALGTALYCAQRGKKVFYLSLESIQSTPAFFSCDSGQGLSNIFFFLRESSKNIRLKIEGIRNIDIESGIHFFDPPEITLELEEMSPDEIAFLIGQIKHTDCYDCVMVDLSSELNSRNIAALGACDQIMMVFNGGDIADVKTSLLIKELEAICINKKPDLFKKSTLVLNRFNADQVPGYEEPELGGRTADIKIPADSSLLIQQEGRYQINLNNSFGKAIGELAEKVFNQTLCH